MKRKIWIRHGAGVVLISLLLLLCAQAGFAQSLNWSVIPSHGSNELDTNYKQGELLVRFADGQQVEQVIGPRTTRSVRSAVASSIVSGAYVDKEYDHLVSGLAMVKLPQGVSVPDAVILFNQSTNILYAQPNYKIRALIIPIDPRFPEQWALNNTGQTGGLPDADIDAPQAWDIVSGSPDVIVAVIDSGIDYNHPDLNANMWINAGEVNQPGVVDANDFNDVDDDGNGYNDDIYGYDFVDDDFDPMDENFHGTFVAGIIGAVGNNEEGIAGVCWTVKLMALRVLDANGVGDAANAIEAINYAVAMGASIINASWGSYSYNQALYDAIAAAGDAGILVVAAAGNDGLNSAIYPAGYDLDNIISVMATDSRDRRWALSNYHIEQVDLGAPGEGILSTTPTNETNWMNANGISTDYAFESGTSAAAPHVTGACVLVGLVNPALTPIQIKKIILNTVDETLPEQCVSGGRLNLYNACFMARKGVVINTRTSRRYPTIQQAIDASTTVNGDTIVADSNYWYIETINFKGKAITVRSGDVNSTRIFGVPSPKNTYISALFNGGSVVTFNTHEGSGSTLSGFTIRDGVEGINIKDSSPKISTSIITKNTKSGIYCNNSSPEISDCTTTKNTTEDSGGGIYCNNTSSPKINNCTITDNSAMANGGGIYCDNRSKPDIRNSKINQNQTEGNGGGIYCGTNSDPNIIGCTIGENDANWPGGGIYTINCAPQISDCTITGNTTEWDGAGIYCDTGSLPNIVNCTISSNIAYYDGGGIYCNGVSVPIKNCLFTFNTVVSWDGGGIFAASASPTITNCTFAGNSGNDFDGSGGAIFCTGHSTPAVANCIFSDNNDIAIYEADVESDPVVTFCLFYHNPHGDYYDKDTGWMYNADMVVAGNPLSGSDKGNLRTNPMFVRGRLSNYYLSQYDAGQVLDANGQFVDPNVNPQDARGVAFV
jgi:predicted outer membrane repeat protein